MYVYLELDRILTIGESSSFFLFIAGHLENMYENYSILSDEWPENNTEECIESYEGVLYSTVADVDFNELRKRYSYRAYTKHFKALIAAKFIIKVYPSNNKCHKYYVNPYVINKFSDGHQSEYDEFAIYRSLYSHLWL